MDIREAWETIKEHIGCPPEHLDKIIVATKKVEALMCLGQLAKLRGQFTTPDLEFFNEPKEVEFGTTRIIEYVTMSPDAKKDAIDMFNAITGANHVGG